MDYTDIYVSAFSETDSDYPAEEDSSLLISSAEALSVLGSGVYLGNMEYEYPPEERCEIAKHDANSKTGSAEQSSEHPAQQQSPASGDEGMTHVQHVELAGVGQFEISAFPEGSGFFMRHSDSGESIMATFIMEGNSEAVEDVTLMVYASMPRAKVSPISESTRTEDGPSEENREGSEDEHEDGVDKAKRGPQSPWKLVGPKLASFFKKRRSNPDDEDVIVEMGEPERTVVIADLNSNAFHCQVDLVRRSLTKTSEEVEGESDTTIQEETHDDIVVATYPCAPALFGLTHMSRLIATEGAFVEATVLAPDDDDEFGCYSDEEEPPTETSISDEAPQEDGNDEGEMTAKTGNACENKTIQVVQRGGCSFLTKASNQQKYGNAEGVIVINSEEDELFIMSHGEEGDSTDDDELPLTVLVTGMDGEDLVELIEEQTVNANGEGDVESYLIAQVSLVKQEHAVDTDGSFKLDEDTFDWPIVRGTEEALQIFAEGGWGIHAMRKDGGSIRDVAGSNDLQLFLLRHSD